MLTISTGREMKDMAFLTTLTFVAISIIPAFISTFVLEEFIWVSMPDEAQIACIIDFIIVYTLLLFLIKGIVERCPECHRLSAMKEISRCTIGEYPTTMDVKREVKNRKGEVVRTYYEAVPATRYVYECIDQCKWCGYRRKARRESTTRD